MFSVNKETKDYIVRTIVFLLTLFLLAAMISIIYISGYKEGIRISKLESNSSYTNEPYE